MNTFTSLIKIFPSKTWVRLAVAFGLFLIPMFLFIQLADEVRDRETLPIDEAILRMVNESSSPFLDSFVVGFTQLGDILGVFVLTLGIALLLWIRSKQRSAAVIVVGVAGAGLLNVLLKTVFQRDRPELWERIITENSYSFPSGHAMASSALAISMIVVFWPTRWRWLVTMVSLTYMVGIGLTRLYLGVHYPTDVIAGWIVSGAWIALVMIIVRYHKRITDFLFQRNITKI